MPLAVGTLAVHGCGQLALLISWAPLARLPAVLVGASLRGIPGFKPRPVRQWHRRAAHRPLGCRGSVLWKKSVCVCAKVARRLLVTRSKAPRLCNMC